jgi:hypothetical protein
VRFEGRESIGQPAFGISRRSLLRRGAMTAAALSSVGWLAACGDDDDDSGDGGGTNKPATPENLAGTVVFLNYPAWIECGTRDLPATPRGAQPGNLICGEQHAFCGRRLSVGHVGDRRQGGNRQDRKGGDAHRSERECGGVTHDGSNVCPAPLGSVSPESRPGLSCSAQPSGHPA